MDDARVYDILLSDADELNRRRWQAALLKHLSARIVAQPSARAAITSYSRAKFDAVVCGTQLTDTDCWRLIALIRSARFGFLDTPVFIICAPDEKGALEPLLDTNSTLVESGDSDAMVARIAAGLAGRARPSVLVIEDEPAAADVAFQALDKYFAVEIAQDGLTGLNAWRERQHELVLLDLMLPGMTGKDVQHEILRLKPDQPIIILTAHDGLETHQDHIVAGAREFLSKPTNTHLLPSVCARILREQHVLKHAVDARGRANAFGEVAARVYAAEFNLNRGCTAEAAHHLSHAIYNCRSQGPLDDDQWIQLINELTSRRNSH